MGAGASTVGSHAGKSAEEIATVVAGLDVADRAHLAKSCVACTEAAAVTTNRMNISENEANIHKMYLAVTQNKESVYEQRSDIEGNRSLILKNFSAAFVGNRQMANQNTDDIYKNRAAILDALHCDGAVQENFRKSKYNEANLEYIDNRCKLNNRVAKGNVQLSAVNDKLIALNQEIMKSNEEIVAFNSANIETNTKLMEAGITPDTCTPEANEKRIASNKEMIAKITERNDKYNADAEAKDKAIEDNKAAIQKNESDIAERRKQMKVNRANIRANGEKVAEKLRNCTKPDDVDAAVKALADGDKANLAKALEAPIPTNAAIEENRKKIAENEANIHQMHLDVMTNKEKLYAVRSLIMENRELIFKNYIAAFMCNRQCANQNTDDIFKNRRGILRTLKVENQSQENYRHSKANEAKIAYLENRSLLNNRVAKANKTMSDINTELITINNQIMTGNEEIVAFNAAAIETNTKLLAFNYEDEETKKLIAQKCTPEANAARIQRNADKIALIQSKVGNYDVKVDDQLKKALANRDEINKNSEGIKERRHAIKENRKLIKRNGEKVTERIRS